MSETRLRWLKWWPQDDARDPALRMCSLAARGLWREMLALAHDADPYGHVLVNGRSPSPRQLANIVSAPERDVVRLLQELDDAGVFSRDASGVIYCRRMVRDNATREKAKEDGKRGGNPSLKAKCDDGLSGGVNPPLKLQEAEARGREERTPSQPSAVRPQRGSRLPADWQPEPDESGFAHSLGLNPDNVAAQFRDYWHAKPGKEAVKLDWSATWRGWCRRDAERRPVSRQPTDSKLDWMLTDPIFGARQ